MLVKVVMSIAFDCFKHFLCCKKYKLLGIYQSTYQVATVARDDEMNLKELYKDTRHKA